MNTAEWTFMLYDQVGAALAELTHASGKMLTFRRNNYHTANLTLSIEDAEYSTLLTYLQATGIPVLRAYRDQVLRFSGHLYPISEDAEETGLATLEFRSPLAWLFERRYTGLPYQYVAQDQMLLAQFVIANLTYGVGAAVGSYTSSGVTRDLAIKAGDNIGDLLLSLTRLSNGIEFIEVPTTVGGYGASSSISLLYPTAGTDRPAARFEYGADTLANVRHVHRTILRPVNDAYVEGANGIVGHAQDLASQALYNVHQAYESMTDVSLTAQLNARATSLLRPVPSRLITFTPDPALAPKPFDEWTIADTCRFFARRGAMLEAASVRVNSFTLAVDDNGREAFDIPDPDSVDEDQRLLARMETEITA